MASLQVKNGIWHAVFYVIDISQKRKQKWISTGYPAKPGYKKKAIQRMNEIELEYLNQERRGIKNSDVLFCDYVRTWLNYIKDTIELDTYEGYTQYAEKHIIPYFKMTKVKTNKLTATDISNFYNYQITQGRLDGKGGVSPASVKRYSVVIKGTIDLALINRILSYNPMDGVRLPKQNKSDIAKFYSVDEAQELLNVSKDDCLYLVIRFALLYGLRRSEILGLRWKDIDFKSKKICISNTTVSVTTIQTKERTKNSSSHRTLPLDDDTIQDLVKTKQNQMINHKNYMANKMKYNINDFVFKKEDGTPFLPNFISCHFRRLLKANDLRKIRFHDLRHTTVSLLLKKGVPIKIIQKYVGHATANTTLNFYSHIIEDDKIIALENMKELTNFTA